MRISLKSDGVTWPIRVRDRQKLQQNCPVITSSNRFPQTWFMHQNVDSLLLLHVKSASKFNLTSFCLSELQLLQYDSKSSICGNAILYLGTAGCFTLKPVFNSPLCPHFLQYGHKSYIHSFSMSLGYSQCNPFSDIYHGFGTASVRLPRSTERYEPAVWHHACAQYNLVKYRAFDNLAYLAP